MNANERAFRPDRTRRLSQGRRRGRTWPGSVLCGGGLVRSAGSRCLQMAEGRLRAKDRGGCDQGAVREVSGGVSDKVKLDAPEIAENGAVVPISVSSTLPDVTSIAILVPENPFPLAAAYKIPAGTSPMVAQPPEDGQDQQGRGGGRGRRQALQRDQRGQGHGRRLRRLTDRIDRKVNQWHRQFACALSRAVTPPKSSRSFSIRWIPASSRTPRAT